MQNGIGSVGFRSAFKKHRGKGGSSFTRCVYLNAILGRRPRIQKGKDAPRLMAHMGSASVGAVARHREWGR